jgi:AcrR family transcriptional regulator
MFLEKGYRGTSMELVAIEASSGRQTVYNQFESKKALFDATVTLIWDGMPVEKIISRVGSERPFEHVLLEIGNAIAEFWAPDEAVAFARMIIAESISFPELGKTFFTSGRNPVRRAVVDYFISLHRSEALNFSDPDLAAAQFIGLINESLLWPRVLTGGPSSSREHRTHIVTEAVKTFLARYGSPRPDSH